MVNCVQNKKQNAYFMAQNARERLLEIVLQEQNQMHSLEEKHSSKRREPKWYGIGMFIKPEPIKKWEVTLFLSFLANKVANFSLQFSKQKQKLYKLTISSSMYMCNEGKKTKNQLRSRKHGHGHGHLIGMSMTRVS